MFCFGCWVKWMVRACGVCARSRRRVRSGTAPPAWNPAAVDRRDCEYGDMIGPEERAFAARMLYKQCLATAAALRMFGVLKRSPLQMMCCSGGASQSASIARACRTMTQRLSIRFRPVSSRPITAAPAIFRIEITIAGYKCRSSRGLARTSVCRRNKARSFRQTLLYKSCGSRDRPR